MTKISSTGFLFLLIAIALSAVTKCMSAVSNKRLCYDPNCSVPISLAKTTVSYNSADPQILSFAINIDVTIYSKSAGKNEDLWGVEINGKRGYIPKRFLKENKILQTKLKHEVPVEEYIGGVNKSNTRTVHHVKEEKKLDIALEANINQKGKSTTEEDTKEKTEENVIVKTEKNVTVKAEENVKEGIEPNHEHASSTIKSDEKEDLNSLESTEKKNLDVDSENKEQIITEDITHSYEVIDGTTIILDNDESYINPTIVAETTVETTSMQHEPLVGINPLMHTNLTGIDPDSTSEKSIDYLESSKEVIDILMPGITKSGINTSGLNATIKPDSFNLETKLSDNTKATETLEISNNLKINVEKPEITEPEVEKSQNSAIDSTEKEENKQETDKESKINDFLPNSKLGNIQSLSEGKQDLKEDQNVSTESTENVSDENIEKNETEPMETQNTEINSFPSVIDTPAVFTEEETEESSSETFEEDMLEDETTDNMQEIDSTTTVPSLSSSVEEDSKVTSAPETELLQNNIVHQEIETISIPETKNDAVENKEQNVLQKEIIVDNSTELPIQDQNVNNDVHNDNIISSGSNEVTNEYVKVDSYEQGESLESSQSVLSKPSFNEFPGNRNLLNVEETVHDTNVKLSEDEITQDSNVVETLLGYGDDISSEDKVLTDDTIIETQMEAEGVSTELPHRTEDILQTKPLDTCTATGEDCSTKDEEEKYDVTHSQQESQEGDEENNAITVIPLDRNHWESLMYVALTAFTTLMFSLGYYYIENMKRDRELIAKINKLEKELLVSTKECTVLDENLKTTKSKLTCIEDKSFGSDEMVLSLKAELEASQNAKAELEEQVASLEKDLEGATEAGLELERMLREVLSSNNEVNPLAQSVEDLQARLNTQQAANESLKNALDLKIQEIEALTADLVSSKKRCDELEVELTHMMEKLNTQVNLKNSIEQTLTDRVQELETQVKNITAEKTDLHKELKSKEAEVADLTDVIKQVNSNNLDLEKLYEVSHIKAEALQLLEERDELKERLSEIEGAHNLLEEHVKLVKEEMSSLSEQCKLAEKEKKDAETRLEVLSNFFKEKEAERQKEEAMWLQKQGEVSSTVERIQTMQSELQGYRQQVEMLKREILDQEREYKTQISALETKAHEQWVIARQNERRLEESKVEAGQLRNRLTLIEKNINDADPDVKLHRLEANGETTTSPHLFIGAESSGSPIMFSGPSGMPPPPPSYMPFPPYLPLPLPTTSGMPPYDVGQRPPPLGGRLSSPPPMPLHPPAPSGRYDSAGSPPPPMSPRLPPPPFNRHRSPPPPPFGSDIHPPPPPLSGSMFPPPLGTTHSWGEETLPPMRNTGFHPHQREQRTRNHKGSLHSSGDSLDKTHLSGKV